MISIPLFYIINSFQNHLYRYHNLQILLRNQSNSLDLLFFEAVGERVKEIYKNSKEEMNIIDTSILQNIQKTI